MDGFSNDQMFANKQFRLQNALFKAGVHETDYGALSTKAFFEFQIRLFV